MFPTSEEDLEVRGCKYPRLRWEVPFFFKCPRLRSKLKVINGEIAKKKKIIKIFVSLFFFSN